MKRLDEIEWKEFYLKDIFLQIQRGKRLRTEDHLFGKMPYISSTSMRNGLGNFVENKEKVRIFENCLTLANSGSVGACFFQPFRFVASDHVTQLANNDFNKYIYLFLATMASRLSEKYSFNREINDTRIKREKLLLPVNKEGNPDYAFMDTYMRNKEQELLQKYQQYIGKKRKAIKHIILLEEKQWKTFKLLDIFYFEKGNQNKMVALAQGDTPLVSAKNCDNGYKSFVSMQGAKKKFFPANCLTINNDGDGGAGISYYQPNKMALDSHVTALIPRIKLDKYTLLFISGSITRQRGKFGHGYSLNASRLRAFMFMLPVDENGNPDYKYMADYMESWEIEQIHKYLEYLQKLRTV